MIDYEGTLCEDKDLSAAITTDAVDFHQAQPDTGLWDEPLYIAVTFPTAADGDGTISFTIQDSEDGETFAAAGMSGVIAAKALTEPQYIPLPIRHKRYVRVVTAVDGTVTGTCSMYIADKATAAMNVKKQGIDVVQTVD